MMKASLAVRFNQFVVGDLFFIFEKVFLMLIDDCLRYRIAAYMPDKRAISFLRALLKSWIRYFGPMEHLVFDQDSAVTSEMCTQACDRFLIKRRLSGVDAHTPTGFVERAIGIIKLTALKSKKDALREGLVIDDATIVEEASMIGNLTLNYGNATPAQALLGYTPRDYYVPDGETIDCHAGALMKTPDEMETAIRFRMLSKSAIIQAIMEERIAKANTTRQQKVAVGELKPGETDVYGRYHLSKATTAGEDPQHSYTSCQITREP